MPSITRVPVAWQGLTALPGVSIFYGPFGTDMTVELAAFFNAIKGQFPTALTWTIPPNGDIISAETGKLTGAWIGGTGASISGSAGSVSYAAGVGAYVVWQTGTVLDGHRVKGRTFLAPLTTGAFDTSGTILTAAISAFQGAANTLAASGKTVVWHRPHKGLSDGAVAPITGALVPDQVTSLRTRRR